MANTFINPVQVVQTAVALLRDDLVLAATVNRDFEADFGGGRGSTVNVRRPAVLVAHDRALNDQSAITVDDLTEEIVPVSLDTMAYSAVKVTDEDLTLNIEDFARQVLSPQVVALSERIENKVAAEMKALAESTAIAYNAATPAKTFTAARKALRKMGVAPGGMYAACGAEAYAELLDSTTLTDASQAGDTLALRDAEVRKLRGFNVFESTRLGDTDIVFYSRDSFTLAVRAPRVPDGVAFGQSLATGGFALRWIKDYDSVSLNDRSIVSAFIGSQAMTARHLKADGTHEDVVPALRVDIATP